MKDKFIDLSEQGASLNIKLDQLVIRHADGENSVPLEELAALIISNPAVCLTQAVLSGVCSNGGTIVICDSKRLPIGLLFPLFGHSTQTETISAQTSASVPTKKQLWRQIIKAKLLSQAVLLQSQTGNDSGLIRMASRVKSGDPENLEAQAARRYWSALFGLSFRRVPGATDPLNSLLNYGYAILRGIVARAVAASGLHPSMGIHHHNRYNPFCLADDIMEPFRPIVDSVAFDVISSSQDPITLDRKTKTLVIEAINNSRIHFKQGSNRLLDGLSTVTASLAAVYLGNRKRIDLPEIRFEKEET
jgi:CRISPR-associated protein Cas1